MFKNKKILAFIPARAGSKRIIILLITALIITAVGSFLKYKKNEI